MSLDQMQWHNHTIDLRPENAQLDPELSKIVVAILRHSATPSTDNIQDDYLWINCKLKTTFKQLLKAYDDKHPEAGSVALCHDGKRCDISERVEEYVVSGALVLEAVAITDLPARMGRSIAQRTVPSSDIPAATPAPTSSAHQSTPRDPLKALSPNIRQVEQTNDAKSSLSPNAHSIRRNTPANLTSFTSMSPSNLSSSTTGPTLQQQASVSRSQPSPVPPAAPSRSVRPPTKFVNYGPPASNSTTSKSPTPMGSTTSRPSSSNPSETRNVSGSPQLPTSSVAPLKSNYLGEHPSRHIRNQNVNQPFLRYLDHCYKNSASLHMLSLSELVDSVWAKWKSLPEKSAERDFFVKPIQARFRNMGLDEWDTERDMRTLEDVKPEVPRENGGSQTDNAQPVLDFRTDFGPIEDTNASNPEPKQSFQMQELINGSSLEDLETYVTKGVKWLDRLEEPLGGQGSQSNEATAWLDQIKRIKTYAARTKTVIGVVGNTGAGKSSVINAMLDEEQLLPTNTMRACTAVVTELSYNHGTGCAYRAEVEFIDEKSWHQELKILFDELIDDSGNVVSDSSKADSNAGIAYAKIKAVYPKKTKEDIAHSTISNMLKEVSHILGKTKKIEHNDCLVFYQRLQKYIDSQEKAGAKKTADDKKKPREMEFWPLIKVVRIYCKSPALATGATIVDLPGVHDANEARAAVAEGYMKQCSGLWIVAPIIRAVDDKAAKNLLGQTFKRQLKMDGGFGQVSFICSKTDDISNTEATKSLGLEETNDPLWRESDEQGELQTELENKIKECSEAREALGSLLDTIDSNVEKWEEIQEEFDEDGPPVYAPAERRKRKRARKNASRKKQRRSDDDESNAEEESEAADEDSEDDDAEVSIRKPLTSEDISEQLTKLKNQRKNVRTERVELNHKIKDLKEEVKNSKEKVKRAQAIIAENCIKGRNEYSKQAIQHDFAAGIRELDQETAQDEDPDNFNPDEDIRDYEEIARSLPVFCVSSRGYQQLRDRRKKDAKVHGFNDVDQTEIPALQQHCKQLTVASRQQACKKFLVSLSTLANSLALWASSDGSGSHLTAEQRKAEDKLLSKSLAHLDNGLERLIDTITKSINQEVISNLYSKYQDACQHAVTRAHPVAERWGNSKDGGHVWSTYKATCRRDGAYTNARGPIDFNMQLSDPMMMGLVTGWERLFSRRIPAILSSLSPNLKNLLKTFHSDVAKRSQLSGIGIALLPMLEQQLDNYEHAFDEVATSVKQMIDGQQKEVNRSFVPFIKTIMTPAYEGCVAERGPGSFKRMQAIMTKHVNDSSNSMFRESCAAAKVELNRAFHEAKKELEDAADDVYQKITRDYRSTFSGTDMKPGQTLPKWHREMRKVVTDLLEDMERYLTTELDADDEEDKDLAAMQLHSENDAIKSEDEDEIEHEHEDEEMPDHQESENNDDADKIKPEPTEED